jgi:hypothetical protein
VASQTLVSLTCGTYVSASSPSSRRTCGAPCMPTPAAVAQGGLSSPAACAALPLPGGASSHVACVRLARGRRDAPGKGDGWGPPGRRPCVNGGNSDMSRWWKRRRKETNRYVCKEWRVGNFVTQKQMKAGSEMLSSLY